MLRIVAKYQLVLQVNELAIGPTFYSLLKNGFTFRGSPCATEDRTTLNASTTDVIVDSLSNKTNDCTIQVDLLWELDSREHGYS